MVSEVSHKHTPQVRLKSSEVVFFFLHTKALSILTAPFQLKKKKSPKGNSEHPDKRHHEQWPDICKCTFLVLLIISSGIKEETTFLLHVILNSF